MRRGRLLILDKHGNTLVEMMIENKLSDFIVPIGTAGVLLRVVPTKAIAWGTATRYLVLDPLKRPLATGSISNGTTRADMTMNTTTIRPRGLVTITEFLLRRDMVADPSRLP